MALILSWIPTCGEVYLKQINVTSFPVYRQWLVTSQKLLAGIPDPVPPPDKTDGDIIAKTLLKVAFYSQSPKPIYLYYSIFF